MPYTPAHAVVALPFVRSRRVPAAAVAAGAIAPDLPLFVSGGAGYDVTHTLWAAVTIDVLLGAACLALWWSLVRPGLLAVLPAGLRARIGPRRRFHTGWTLGALAGGALSHVVWDAFTHRGRFGSVLLPVLATRVGPVRLTSWLQYGSGVVGLTVLLVAVVVAVRRSEPSRTADAPLGRWTLLARAAVVGIPVVALIATVALAWQSPVRPDIFTVATVVPLWLGVALALVGAVARAARDR